MKFLVFETDTGQFVLANYFATLGFYALESKDTMSLFLPATHIPQDPISRRVAARMLKNFAQSLLLGIRPKLDAFYAKNPLVESLTEGFTHTENLKNLLAHYDY